MDVDYLNKSLMEDTNEMESLTKESVIILVFSLAIVIILTICLFSVMCYDCINSEELYIDCNNPKMETEPANESSKMEAKKKKRKSTKKTKSWGESNEISKNNSPDIIWV